MAGWARLKPIIARFKRPDEKKEAAIKAIGIWNELTEKIGDTAAMQMESFENHFAGKYKISGWQMLFLNWEAIKDLTMHETSLNSGMLIRAAETVLERRKKWLRRIRIRKTT